MAVGGRSEGGARVVLRPANPLNQMTFPLLMGLWSESVRAHVF